MKSAFRLHLVQCCLCLLLPFSLLGCGGTESVVADLPESREKLAVYDKEGHPDTLYLDANTAAFTMATWCPHSHELLGMLGDSLMVPKLAGQELVFLFERNEMLRVMRQIDEDSSLSDSDKALYRTKVTERMQPEGGIRLLDRSMLAEVPGEVYFYDEASGLNNNGFPSAYSGKHKDFTTNRLTWLLNNCGCTTEEFKGLWARHLPEDNVATQ